MVDARVRVEASLGLGQPGHRRMYVGYLGETPVGTALLFLGADVAGLYSVATVPEARRRGIGQAMTLQPLLDVRAMGYQIGTLNASEMGFGIYARLGFQEYCRLGRYLWSGA